MHMCIYKCMYVYIYISIRKLDEHPPQDKGCSFMSPWVPLCSFMFLHVPPHAAKQPRRINILVANKTGQCTRPLIWSHF